MTEAEPECEEAVVVLQRIEVLLRQLLHGQAQITRTLGILVGSAQHGRSG